MAGNLQWKSFQSPVTAATPLQDILELQNPMQVKQSGFRNGSYSGEYPSSPRDPYPHASRFSGGGGAFGSGEGSTVGVFSQAASPPHYESANHPNRETGIIEKLLHSYGFIQCCERQARLFFHFSQFSGNIEHLKIGDPVEFEMTYDRRTGKPIASTVTKIAPEVVLSEARVTGTVTTELRGEGVGDTTGRISYENRGECFFLPYTKDDVEGNVTLSSGDAVSFQIATNQRGNLGACHVRLENPAHPVKYHGVVCSMKESFGFIERADVVKEIFFHFSEAKTKEELNLGDDVEFIIQTRNGKEVACNITRLPTGSVVFEDVCLDITRGQVLKPLERGNAARHQNDPLPGRIRYRAPDHSEVDVPFGDKDQSGEFTLRHGDWVQFQVATDRRDQLKRATNISLLDDSFTMSGERRERGKVSAVKDGFGFLRCVEREPHLFFHFTEILQMGLTLNVDDEVEFTMDPVASFSNTRPSATRIKLLERGSVQFETLIEKGVLGLVTKEPMPRNTSPSKPPQENTGVINYQNNGTKKTVNFTDKDVEGKIYPRQGDKVVFDVWQVKSSKELIAMNIVVQTSQTNGNCASNGARDMLQGFIVALKDGFGFIETKEHDKEIFFHFSNFEGSIDILELGRDVEYLVGRQGGAGGGCCSAELVRALPRHSVPLAKAIGSPVKGTVVRALRALNPDQPQYSGAIEALSGEMYEYGIMGLACKRELLRVGEPVIFHVDTANRATNIIAVRKKRRATVESVKGSFGFLDIGCAEDKNLIFYMSEVKGGVTLQPGDVVEYILVTNYRSGKSSACNVTRIGSFNGSLDGASEGSKDSEYFSRQSSSGSLKNQNTYLQGVVSKALRSYNSEQPQSNGIIDGSNGETYEFSASGLAYKRDILRIGDAVSFQGDALNRATAIVPTRKKRRATVESIKGSCGFLSVEMEEGKKIMFYLNEVRGSGNGVQAGDTVEYTIQQRNGKTTACNVTKVSDGIGSTARPERLINRLRTASLEEHTGPRLMVLRQPRGPDGTKGFKPRTPYNPFSPEGLVQQ